MQNFSEKLAESDFINNIHQTWPDNVTFETQVKWWRKIKFINQILFTIQSIYSYYYAGKLTQNIGALPAQHSGLFSFKQVKCCTRAGVKIHYEGLHHLIGTDKKPAVIIANHMSMVETMILPVVCVPHNNVAFVIKKSLLDYPFIGTVLRHMNAIAVERKNPRDDLKKIIEEGTQMLKTGGRSVIIFPQSTRSTSFDIINFNTIGVKLAKNANAKIIPVALKTDFLGKGKILKDYGKIDPKKTIYISFGAPIEVEGNGKAAHQKVVDFIREKVSKWGVPIIEIPKNKND